MAQAGFDCTHVSARKFATILKKLGLEDRGLVKISSYDAWVFQNNELTIRTGNHPITGKYNAENRREDEKGYCSYIGIEGEQEAVTKAYNLIHKASTYEPEGSPTASNWI